MKETRWFPPLKRRSDPLKRTPSAKKNERWFPRLAKRSEISKCSKCGHVRLK